MLWREILLKKLKNIFIKNNLQIKNSKKLQVSKDEAAEFYKVHQSKPFYNDLCTYLSSGPIVVMILEGDNAIKNNRKLMAKQILKKLMKIQLENYLEFQLIKTQFTAQTLRKMQKRNRLFFKKLTVPKNFNYCLRVYFIL